MDDYHWRLFDTMSLKKIVPIFLAQVYPIFSLLSRLILPSLVITNRFAIIANWHKILTNDILGVIILHATQGKTLLDVA